MERNEDWKQRRRCEETKEETIGRDVWGWWWCFVFGIYNFYQIFLDKNI